MAGARHALGQIVETCSLFRASGPRQQPWPSGLSFSLLYSVILFNRGAKHAYNGQSVRQPIWKAGRTTCFVFSFPREVK